MRYSLLSKFQGALLGAALGDFLGIQYQRQLLDSDSQNEGFNLNLNKTKLQNLRWGGDVPGLKLPHRDFKFDLKLSSSGGLALLWAKSLIQLRGWDLKDWREIWVGFSHSELTRFNAQLNNEAIGTAEELLNRKNVISSATSKPKPFMLSPSEAAVATLPTAMFFHENKAQLREKLEQLAVVWHSPNYVEQDSIAGPLAVGYAIARALKEKLNPASLIPETVTYLGVDTPLTALLLQVQILLDQGASLEAAVIQLCKNVVVQQKQHVLEGKSEAKFVSPSSFLPIAIAFYCFLNTPEDLRLAVVRAARTGIEPQLTCSLVGAISGAYNSKVSIPLEWRLAVEQNSASSELAAGRAPLLWGKASYGEIVELAANLLAIWSGAYHSDSASELLSYPVVAAPYVIRPYQV
ncbi:MAG TPA: ADP-ribosylglycohydrolase family protein [Kamptonema sp.]|nr:ADP-ribosylglycohydrolase family protein [Kamptonema sp.]